MRGQTGMSVLHLNTSLCETILPLKHLCLFVSIRGSYDTLPREKISHQEHKDSQKILALWLGVDFATGFS
jgi:hypothetical protein